MPQIRAATLSGSVSPATVDGTLHGSGLSGRISVTEVDGALGGAELVGAIVGASLSGTVALAEGISDYAGPYEVVPSRDAQVLSTAGKRMASDLTVAPIPSNYGLITWDGSKLTVS